MNSATSHCCRIIAEKPCMQPQTEGPCRANIPRFYFDLAKLKCLIFDYGGCQGNRNNFATESDCETHCRGLANTGESVYSSRYRSAGGTHLYFPGGGSGTAKEAADKDGNLQISISTVTSATTTRKPFGWWELLNKYFRKS